MKYYAGYYEIVLLAIIKTTNKSETFKFYKNNSRKIIEDNRFSPFFPKDITKYSNVGFRAKTEKRIVQVHG